MVAQPWQESYNVRNYRTSNRLASPFFLGIAHLDENLI
jgi:hypothetical protein